MFFYKTTINMHWVPTFEYAFYELETKTSKPNCKSNKNLSTACKWIRNLLDYLYNFHYHCNCIRAKIHLSVSLNSNSLFEYNWCTFLRNCTVARFRLNPEDIRCNHPQWINYRIYWNGKMRTTSSCKKTSASLNIYLWVYVFSVGNIPWIIQVSPWLEESTSACQARTRYGRHQSSRKPTEIYSI